MKKLIVFAILGATLFYFGWLKKDPRVMGFVAKAKETVMAPVSDAESAAAAMDERNQRQAEALDEVFDSD